MAFRINPVGFAVVALTMLLTATTGFVVTIVVMRSLMIAAFLIGFAEVLVNSIRYRDVRLRSRFLHALTGRAVFGAPPPSW